jgi:hypothetical protein
MTNAAHTPGPWDVDNYPDHVSYFSDASNRKPDYDFRVDFSEDMPEEEAEANARLIAAAPDLLEALEELLFMTHPDTFGGSMEEARATASAAIAKAKAG